MMKTNDIILQACTKIVLFIILLFSVQMFFAGHYHPGGGFIAGLMTSAALVLLMLAYDMKTIKKILPIDYKILTAIGLLFAVGTATSSLFINVPFLTHVFGHVDLPIVGDTSLHTATLFDLGVYLVVVGITMTIIQTIGEDE